MTVPPHRETESVDAFRDRAREWIEAHLPAEDAGAGRDPELQGQIYDAGFAGIAFPREYGGAGLTHKHQRIFFDTAAALGRRTPQGFGVSIGMIGATLLDHGSEDLKLQHIPAILRGDERWIQLLSEPSGGSDLAGATTRLTRDGESYRLNGSKMWSTAATVADFGLCLTRSDWTVSKHQGLSMVAVPLKNTMGVTIEPIRHATGDVSEFCLEFFDDVVLPLGNLVGAEGDGWSVAQSLLFHERDTTSGIGHGYGLMNTGRDRRRRSAYDQVSRGLLARDVVDDHALRQHVASAYIEATVAECAAERIMEGMQSGALQGQWGSLLKLQLGVNAPQVAKEALATWGPEGVIWDGDMLSRDGVGEAFLTCRGVSISGGTNEIQRNIVSERLLGLPREPSVDVGMPFDEVIRRRRAE